MTCKRILTSLLLSFGSNLVRNQRYKYWMRFKLTRIQYLKGNTNS
jgi:hypothetical protein